MRIRTIMSRIHNNDYEGNSTFVGLGLNIPKFFYHCENQVYCSPQVPISKLAEQKPWTNRSNNSGHLSIRSPLSSCRTLVWYLIYLEQIRRIRYLCRIQGKLFEDDGNQDGSQALHHVVGHQHVNLKERKLGQPVWGRGGGGKER